MFVVRSKNKLIREALTNILILRLQWKMLKKDIFLKKQDVIDALIAFITEDLR